MHDRNRIESKTNPCYHLLESNIKLLLRPYLIA